MKKCTVCLEVKQFSEFYKRAAVKNGVKSECKQCTIISVKKSRPPRAEYLRRAREGAARRRTKLNQFLWDYFLAHPCVDCGETDPPVLEFDHRDATTKEQGISQMVSKLRPLKHIQEEIAKCDVRCANCHRRRTAIQLGWYKNVKRKA